MGRFHSRTLRVSGTDRKTVRFQALDTNPTGEGTQTLMSLPPGPGEIDDTGQVHRGPCAHGITVQAERQTTKQTGCSAREGN